MSEDNGSAEQQAERMRERSTEASQTSLSKRRRERYGGEERDPESAVERLLRAGRRLLERPGGRTIAGAALLLGSAALLGAREARERRGLRGLRRHARSAVDSFQEARGDARPQGLAVLTGLAALALAGVTWTRIDAIERPRRRVDLP
jgi:hypothetical protein